MTADCTDNSVLLNPIVADAAWWRFFNAGYSPAICIGGGGVRISCVCPSVVFDNIVRAAHNDVATEPNTEFEQAATVAAGGAL